jgi:DNA-binding MarR family transcriptional regulator|tara:strand:- start:44412 stop:44948 length:537 start_codon:yes stop_codon:yes gene_type:complete
MLAYMLQVKDIPNAEILQKFADRYPQTDIKSVMTFLNLLRVGSDLSHGLNSYLAGYDLLQGRWWVLLLLMREDDLSSTPSLLAEKAGVSRATMTGLLDGLLREKLISRVHGRRDRRQILIRLTAKGQAKLDEVMPGYYQRVNLLMQALTETEALNLMSLLEKIYQRRHVFEDDPILNK